MASTLTTASIPFLALVFFVGKIHSNSLTGFDNDKVNLNLLCYTCLRPDGLNANVSCWTDRRTEAIDCGQYENRCIDLILNGSPDFVALRKTCQPEDAILNPCLFYKGVSYQVAGTQSYTVNGERSKCVCLDICDAMSHHNLFPLGYPEAERKTSFPIQTGNCSSHMPEKPLLEGKVSINDLDGMKLPWDLALDSGAGSLRLTYTFSAVLLVFLLFAAVHAHVN